MIEKLSTLRLPVDDLLQEYCQREIAESFIRLCRQCTRSEFVKNLVTLSLVNNTHVMEMAKKYIAKQLEEKQRYGYLYYISGQNLLIPIDVQCKGDLFIQCGEEDRVMEKLEDIADNFARRDTKLYKLIVVELFSFYIRLVNPNLSWLAVDYMLQCAERHAHLIISPNRPYSWKKINT